MESKKPQRELPKKKVEFKDEGSPITEDEIGPIEDEIESKPDLSSEKLANEISTKVPEKLFFKKGEEDFGLKAGDISLNKVKRESLTSKYLRYLKAKDEIAQDLEKGLLLDVDYDGGQNKAYCDDLLQFHL